MGSLKGAGFLLATLILLVLSSVVRADESFTVKKIEVFGLQRISQGTLYDYLPVNVGDQLDSTRLQQAIRALYKTGFFRDVELRRDGDTLVIVIKERPSIAHFTVTGNRLIKTDDLNKNLQKAGLTEGQIFNHVVLDQFKQQLLDEYYSHGHYGVILKSTVTDVSDNRVDVSIDIAEGATATIRSINIVGNHAFSESDLVDTFKLKVASFWTFFGSSDEYAREKLVGDLESIRSYYMDRGYADFAIDSTQVAISPDHDSVYITVGVAEGDVYTVKDVKLSGQFVVPEDQLRKFLLIKPGDTFSLKRATATADLIRQRLGVDGYAFAKVNPIPDIDRTNKAVAITFYIDPGERVYVRHINFQGASDTDDEVFRREMRIFEGAWLSSIDLERSRIRLERLPWVEEAQVATTPVPGAPSLVDVDFTIKERPPGTANIGLGYGSSSGFVLDGQIVNANFLGTGERLQVQATHTTIGHSYSFSFTKPYVTVDGVSRTLSFFQTRTSALTVNSAALTTNTYGVQLGYDIPLSEYSAWGAGINYSRSQQFSQLGTSPEYISFLSNPDNGNVFYTLGVCQNPFSNDTFSFFCRYPALSYDTLETSVSYVHDTRNRIIFPDNGTRESISLNAAVPGGDLRYYILTYQQYAFIPLFKGFLYALSGEADYGAAYSKTSPYPPFKHFFAGGPDSVRGWQPGTLGPFENGFPIGGRAMFYAQNELVLPRFGKQSGSESGSSRFALFVDVGNVFTTPGDFRFRDLRYSWGAAATFLTPLGAMKFSYAFPVNPKPGDQTERFQFTLGTYF